MEFLAICAALLVVARSDNSESDNPQTVDAASNATPDASQGLDAGGSHDAIDQEDGGAVSVSDWVPVSSLESYRDRSLSDWVLEWARWHLEQNDCDRSAYFDIDGSLCGTQQPPTSPVFFLEGGEYPTARSQCRVPADKALLVPLTYFVSDGRDVFLEIPSEDELRAEAERVLSSMRDFQLRIDGARIENIEEGRAELVRLDVEFPPEPNYYTCRFYPGIEGLKAGIFVVGVFALLPPPRGQGEHLLEYEGTHSYDGWDQVTRVSTVLTFE